MSLNRPNMTKIKTQHHAKRTFTLAEANRSLVLVKRIVADIIDEHARLLDLQEALDAAEAVGSGEQCEEIRLNLIRSAGRLRSCLVELDNVGVELKDWSMGVVDFPCIAAGRPVLLCWQFGEQNVEHWHEMEGGFASLQPIETLPIIGQYAGRQTALASAPEPAEDPPGRDARRSLPKS